MRDYFLAQMHRFEGIPRGVLAQSTHVRGTGTYNNGIESPRIEVVLATAIPRTRCEQLNLGYLDPAKLDISDYKAREAQGICFVDHAAEILHKLSVQQHYSANCLSTAPPVTRFQMIQVSVQKAAPTSNDTSKLK